MSQQLALPLDGADSETGSTLPARLALRAATEGGAPFDDGAYFFEPWWPGAHAWLRRSGDRLEIRSEHLSDPLAAFPELRSLGAQLSADEVVVEGTLLALDADGRPDVGLLRRRLGGIPRPNDHGEGAFVASDLLYLDARSLKGQPFSARRERLANVLADSDHCVLSRGLVAEGVTMGHAVAALGLDAISARRLDARWRPGMAGDAWLHIAVSDEPAKPTRPFLVLLEKLPLGE
ncbi:MAG: hypothetical protein ACC726_16140 [Chloroflexota bacterium]